ncbi:aquaporin AQPAe.a-like [Prorops nasuta]|uniref:aquaporin AQPAe.a-like n=1 Tax=Prorops nasuta TaxID=863751 RepID=UPI0034CD6202
MSQKLIPSRELWKIQSGTLTMFIAECIGTGILIFIGCMGCIGTMTLSPPPPLQTALTFGLTVNLIIMMLGHVSGAHLNPAVTIGSVIMGLKSIPTAFIYCVAQVIGATIGYFLLMTVTPGNLFNDGFSNSTLGLCVTEVHPSISLAQAFIIETLCTAFILLGACATWDRRCAHTTDSTALRFGFSVAAISFAAGPYTGCSMNPARSFGPALWNGAWKNQWLYWLGPTAGGFLGSYTYRYLLLEKESNKKNLNCSMKGLKTLKSAETTQNGEFEAIANHMNNTNKDKMDQPDGSLKEVLLPDRSLVLC